MRRFSFRRRPTPYGILLAEMLLRQTRAQDADRIFLAVLDLVPTPQALAAADTSSLERLIAPVGLPRRASMMVSVGRAIVERHDGKVPSTRADLLTLPGIGPYAAGAVMSIGFGIPSPMVDGPIGRVLKRLGGFDDRARTPYYDKRIWAFAERLLPTTGVREYQLALLDVAALRCRATSPLCSDCPLENICSYAVNP